MPRFIVLGHQAPLEPEFSLEDIPGTAGRLDVLCRCVVTGLLQSHGIRSNTTIETVHQDELTVTFDGSSIRNLRPDERSTAARYRDALEAGKKAIGALPVTVDAGLSVVRAGIESRLAETTAPVIQLTPAGEPITEWDPDPAATFVLSDHEPYSDADLDRLEGHVDRELSLGPVALHADQAITIAHHYLDTNGYRRFQANCDTGAAESG